MNANTRLIVESPLYQGEDEEMTYSLTTTPWGSSPSSVSVVVKDADGTDVSATVMPAGSPGVAGDVITFPEIKSLTADATYRIEVKFTSGANIYEAWCDLYGQT